MMKIKIKRIVTVIAIVSVLLLAVAINFTKVYLSPDGVYYRVDIGNLPVNLNFIGAGDNVSYKNGKFDGPIIQEIKPNVYRAHWFCNDQPYTDEFEHNVSIACNQKTYDFPIYPIVPADEIIAVAPEKTALLSDIHGFLGGRLT